MLPEDRFVGWTGVGNRFREFARIRHQQRTHDSFRNHPCGKPILLCLVRNAGMHEGVPVKLFLHPSPLRVCAPWRISIVFQGGALVTAGHFPANLTSGGMMSPPRSRIRDGRAPGGRHHSVRRRLSRQAGQRRRPLGSVYPCRFTAWVSFATTIRARASAPRPLVPHPGSHTATKRSEVAVPSPPP